MTYVRHADVALVLLGVPLILIPGMPAMGYVIGAGAWVSTRFAVDLAHTRALRIADPRPRAALHVGAMLGRIWLVALAVIAARYAGGTSDGVAAAVLVLAAFTVQLLVTLTLGEGPVPPRTTT